MRILRTIALLGCTLGTGLAVAQPANVPTQNERGSGTHMSRPAEQSAAQPSTSEGRAVRSNPGGLGTLDSAKPGAPGNKDIPSPRTQDARPVTAPSSKPLQGSPRERDRSGGASIDQTREPSTDPKESGS